MTRDNAHLRGSNMPTNRCSVIESMRALERSESCRACDLARHICPGCGADVEHGEIACEDCR